MLKNEKGLTHIQWVITILVLLIFAAITVRILVGENGIIQQKKEESIRNKTENNIVIELTNATN